MIRSVVLCMQCQCPLLSGRSLANQLVPLPATLHVDCETPRLIESVLIHHFTSKVGRRRITGVNFHGGFRQSVDDAALAFHLLHPMGYVRACETLHDPRVWCNVTHSRLLSCKGFCLQQLNFSKEWEGQTTTLLVQGVENCLAVACEVLTSRYQSGYLVWYQWYRYRPIPPSIGGYPILVLIVHYSCDFSSACARISDFGRFRCK